MKLEPEEQEAGGWGDDDDLIIDEGESRASPLCNIDFTKGDISCVESITNLGLSSLGTHTYA